MLLAKVSLFVTILAMSSSHVLIGRVPRQAVSPDNAWGLHPTNKTVPYRMDNTLSANEKEDVFAAMRFWSENTCIDFREARAGDQHVANITKTNVYPTCSAPLGRYSTPSHEVKVGCSVHVDTHEIAHLLGVLHTQDRSDRDKFIKVDQARLNSMNIRNFDKSTEGLFGVPYDYGSVMHYPAGAAADPFFVTIFPIYDRTPGAPQSHPSFYDVLLANIVNNCNATCSETAVKCENGGYIHPRDCSKCICPRGYIGRTCSEIMTVGDCGGILNASDQWQNATVHMYSKEMSRDVFDRSYCSWHIKAPPGKKVELNLAVVRSNLLCTSNPLCSIGFEFKIAVDPRLTGPRFCCPSASRMVSQLSTLPVIAIGGTIQNIPINLLASFTYRFVDGSTTSTLPDDYGIPLEASEPVTTTSTTTTTESPTTTTTTESTSTTTTTESPSTTTTTESPSTTTTTESPSTTTTTESPSTTTTTESPSTTTTTESPSTTTTTESPSTTTTTESPSTTTTTESPSTTTTTESPSTTTTTESPSTTTTTSEAPTTRQLPKTTTTDSTIAQSTTNTTSELSTLPTTETSTELPITTIDPIDYSTTDDESTRAPPTTMRFPATTEQSTESTNEVPIDCTTTYETSTTEASTKTATEYPTTMEDTTTEVKDTSELPTSAYTITDNESPRTSESTASATAMSVSPTTTTTIELPATTELTFTTTTADATDCTTTNEFTNEFTSEPSSAIGEYEICVLKNECFAFVPNAKAFEGLNKKPCLRIQARCLGFVDSNNICTCLWSY